MLRITAFSIEMNTLLTKRYPLVNRGLDNHHIEIWFALESRVQLRFVFKMCFRELKEEDIFKLTLFSTHRNIYNLYNQCGH